LIFRRKGFLKKKKGKEEKRVLAMQLEDNYMNVMGKRVEK